MLKSMKWKMMIPILIAVAVIIAGFSVFVYSTTSKSIQKQGESLVESIKLGLEGAILSREVSEKIMEDEMIAETVLISWIIENGATHEDLKDLAVRGGIDEIWSTDEKGNTTLTSIAPTVEFNFGSDPNGQAAEYMQLLDGKTTQITQPAQIRDVDNEFYKFVGVGSWDKAKPKIIQVARNGQMLLNLEAEIGKVFYMNELNEHLDETVLFAAVVNESGSVLASTKELELAAAGFATEDFTTEQLISNRTKFEGTRSMNYIVPLNDGTYLAITISNSILSTITYATLIAGVIAILVITGIADFTIMRQIRRIKKVRDSLHNISLGAADLTQRIDVTSKDEIGQLVDASNAMMNNFQTIMIEMKNRSEKIHQASDDIQNFASTTKLLTKEIQDESNSVANDSNTQLKSIEESALALEDLAKGIQHITESIMEVSNITNDTEVNANIGMQVVDNLMKELTNLHAKTELSVETTQSLVKLSELIGDFTNVITSISDQTNLLALNASIEAARAGEAGKGFAVVADEVRKLAEESKKAADRISVVVSDVHEETGALVLAITSTAQVLEDGRKIAYQAQSSFSEIAEGVKVIADQVDLVSSASEQMAASTEEISASFEDVALLSKQTTNRVDTMATHADDQAHSMNDMALSVEALFEISNELKDTTSKYTL